MPITSTHDSRESVAEPRTEFWKPVFVFEANLNELWIIESSHIIGGILLVTKNDSLATYVLPQIAQMYKLFR